MKSLIALFAAGLIWNGTCGAAPYKLVEHSRLAVGSWARSVAIGDVNGDGLDDVVLGTDFYFDEANDYHIFIYFQKPDGSLGEPQKFKYADWSNAVDIELGDLDNDGIRDIVAGRTGGVTILLADGADGFLQSAIDTPVDSTDTSIELMDVNRDGNLDIIAQYWYEGATLLFGNGSGGVASQSSLETGAQGYNDLDIGDLTGDGIPDLVVVSGQSDHFTVYPHNGVDGFGEAVSYQAPSGILFPSAVAVGDFDNDGWNDVAVNTPGNNPEAGVWLYRGAVTGVGTEPSKMSTYDIPDALVGTDLDKDGLDDLLVGHSGWAAIGWYIQGENGLATESLVSTVFNGQDRSLAVGDLNDDGCTDAAIADFTYGLIRLEGQNCAPVKAVNDFDGDGRSDLFWHQAGTGVSAIWKGADYLDQQRVTRITNLSWQVAGLGDFDGDGRADVLWHNISTGGSAIWRGGNYATQLPVTRITNLDWMIVGVGDFNGDGKDDMLWRNTRTGGNAIWRSGNYHDQQAVTGVTDVRWKVVAVDDFNGDGADDIMWRHSGTGNNAIWTSGNFKAQQVVAGVADLGWEVAGTGDFNGDGCADVLWRHARRGTNVLWYSADAAKQGFVADMIGREWKVAAVADHDGNRKSDIVWRNDDTGENRLWRSMNGAIERPITDVSNTTWHVIQ